MGDHQHALVLPAQAHEIADLVQKRAAETKSRETYKLAVKIRCRAEYELGDLYLTQEECEALLPIVDTLLRWRGPEGSTLDWLSEGLHKALAGDEPL
jgi:pantothenate kinase-related protein Tda10